MSVKCGNPIHITETHHNSVSEVRHCFESYGTPAPAPAPAWDAHRKVRPNPFLVESSEKQRNFIKSLLADRETELTFDIDSLTRTEASDAISKLLACPRRTDTTGKPLAVAGRVTEDGIYQNPDTKEIFKVQYNKATGTGRSLYAKRCRVTDIGDGKYSVVFSYESGLLSLVKADWKMTYEEAAKFGQMYGICVRCGRDLTDEESIAKGIGPICEGKFK